MEVLLFTSSRKNYRWNCWLLEAVYCKISLYFLSVISVIAVIMVNHTIPIILSASVAKETVISPHSVFSSFPPTKNAFLNCILKNVTWVSESEGICIYKIFRVFSLHFPKCHLAMLFPRMACYASSLPPAVPEGSCFSLYYCYWVLSSFLIFAISLDIKWYLGLMCISLIPTAFISWSVFSNVLR